MTETTYEKESLFGLLLQRVRVHNGRGGMVAEVARGSESKEWLEISQGLRAFKGLSQWCASSSQVKPPKTTPPTGDKLSQTLEPMANTYSNHHRLVVYSCCSWLEATPGMSLSSSRDHHPLLQSWNQPWVIRASCLFPNVFLGWAFCVSLRRRDCSFLVLFLKPLEFPLPLSGNAVLPDNDCL